jgi:glycosyltransferase involved in cell wall biosynthesis
MKISVIVPVYNSASTLDRCINSLISQSFFECEFIFINDGSIDDSLFILEKYKAIDERILVFSQQNQGVSVARNYGLINAKGEYVVFLDADDYLEDDILENIHSIITSQSPCLLIHDFSYIRENNLKNSIKNNSKFYFNKEELISDYLTWNLKIIMGSFTFKKELIIKNNIWFRTDLKYSEDVEFILFLLYFSKNVMINNNLQCNYVDNPNSAVNKISIDRFDTFKSRLDMYHYFKNKEGYNKLESLYLSYLIPESIICVLEIMCRKKKGLLYVVFKSHKEFYYNFLNEKDFDDNTPPEIRDSVNSYKKNKVLFSLRIYIKFKVNIVKSKIYETIYRG